MPSTSGIRDELAGILVAEANKAGGWAYYSGKLSRIEPTCWAMLALADATATPSAAHQQFLAGCQRSDGLLADRSDLPANLSWSALAFVTVSALVSSGATDEFRQRLVETLVKTGGLQLDNTPLFRQNNKLKGWPWIPETFSWIEPTSWCLIALKRAARNPPGGILQPLSQRIDEGEAVLMDRACDSGGWNFGNASAFGTSLPAHIPTTALGLLALHDKPNSPTVRRALAFVEEHWKKELSGTALALSLLCLKIYGRSTEEIETALIHQWQRTRFLGNLATISMACCALNTKSSAIGALTVSS